MQDEILEMLFAQLEDHDNYEVCNDSWFELYPIIADRYEELGRADFAEGIRWLMSKRLSPVTDEHKTTSWFCNAGFPKDNCSFWADLPEIVFDHMGAKAVTPYHRIYKTKKEAF
jgi:hypothetical protein